MRIVLDTNVLFAGLYSRNGASYQLVKMAIDGKLDYAISQLVALEYEAKERFSNNDFKYQPQPAWRFRQKARAGSKIGTTVN
ncbi:MAG: PIN domain-containing protein [bacterium]